MLEPELLCLQVFNPADRRGLGREKHAPNRTRGAPPPGRSDGDGSPDTGTSCCVALILNYQEGGAVRLWEHQERQARTRWARAHTLAVLKRAPKRDLKDKGRFPQHSGQRHLQVGGPPAGSHREPGP